MKQWKTHSTKHLLSSGKWLSVEDRTVETPGGLVIDHWAWVVTPNFVNVVAMDENERLLIFRQGKYGLDDISLAPVGGYIERGEEPLEAAKRELREETGYEAAEWIHLGHFLVDPNRGVAWGDLFLARCARQVDERNADDLEDQELLHLSVVETESALAASQFKVLAWAATISMALMKIKTLASS